MKTIYTLSLRGEISNYLIAWSYKKKHIEKYLNRTLHPNPEENLPFVITEEDDSFVNCPFYELSQNEIVGFGGYHFTMKEWGIIESEFDQFKINMRGMLMHTSIIISGLSDDSKNKWESICNEITSMNEDEINLVVYESFIRNHPLFNNDGSKEAFDNRCKMLEAYDQNHRLDEECRMMTALKNT